MRRTLTMTTLAALLLLAGIGLRSPASNASTLDPQQTIAALETQVASLQPAATIPSAASPAGAVLPSAEERTYRRLVMVQIANEDYILAEWDAVLDAVAFGDSDWWSDARSTASVAEYVFAVWQRAPPPPPGYEAFTADYADAAESMIEVFGDFNAARRERSAEEFATVRASYDEAVDALHNTRASLPDAPSLAWPNENRTIAGSVTLVDIDEDWNRGGYCAGSGENDDIRGGAQVVVRNQAGEIVGIGGLGTGVALSRFSCYFVFEVADLPPVRFYTFAVGRHELPTYGVGDLEAAEWVVVSSIGN